ncbi:hypothetical protein PRtIB026_A28890 [Pseudomonas sp. RtIB026]|nr:hypothetical protein PRtIB026_A28890 [Pseudomonas sp. RtIB026]
MAQSRNTVPGLCAGAAARAGRLQATSRAARVRRFRGAVMGKPCSGLLGRQREFVLMNEMNEAMFKGGL